MAIFYCRLNPPRASFAFDMNAEEAALMQEHARHFEDWRTRGHVKAFGVVADPAGAFGVGIVEFEDEAAARAFTDADPTVRSGRGFSYDVWPMPFGVTL